MRATDSVIFMSLRRLSKALISLILAFLLPIRGECASPKPCRRHKNGEHLIALTFDDGPDGGVTEEILDILAKFGIKATFFVIGVNCEKNPEVLKRIAKEGHEIGNHTYSHPSLKNISKKALSDEIDKNEEIIYSITERSTTLFRPPEGVYTPEIGKVLDERGYTPILWSVDTEDWRCPSSESIVSAVEKGSGSGVIILCHDYVAGKSSTPAALRIFIPRLLMQGYEFVTVSELLSS